MWLCVQRNSVSSATWSVRTAKSLRRRPTASCQERWRKRRPLRNSKRNRPMICWQTCETHVSDAWHVLLSGNFVFLQWSVWKKCVISCLCWHQLSSNPQYRTVLFLDMDYCLWMCIRRGHHGNWESRLKARLRDVGCVADNSLHDMLLPFLQSVFQLVSLCKRTKTVVKPRDQNRFIIIASSSVLCPPACTQTELFIAFSTTHCSHTKKKKLSYI